MTNFPLVSVIIPVYNHEIYIEETIKSILEQDYPNVEIIIINDGSTDRSEGLARKVLEKGNRPHRIITQENAGAHAAINRGMAMAQGEYLTILNSDDYFLPGRLRRMVEVLESTKQRFAYLKV
jgi:glycosyltransferase involved in cell wall biosynthesis